MRSSAEGGWQFHLLGNRESSDHHLAIGDGDAYQKHGPHEEFTTTYWARAVTNNELDMSLTQALFVSPSTTNRVFWALLGTVARTSGAKLATDEPLMQGSFQNNVLAPLPICTKVEAWNMALMILSSLLHATPTAGREEMRSGSTLASQDHRRRRA
jgi:hypothetical protein